MQIREITDLNTYNAFLLKSPYKHYLKMPEWNTFMHQKSLILGFYQDEILVASAFISVYEKPHFWFISKGLCIDYDNLPLLKEAMTCLIAYGKSKKVAFIKMDPNVIHALKDSQGHLMLDYPHEDVTLLLKALGFQHRGYGYGYDGSFNNRFTFVLDLNEDFNVLSKRFSSYRKKSLNKETDYAITTRKGTVHDIDTLMLFEKQLAASQQFTPHSKKYFENLLNTFQNNIHFFVCECHAPTFIKHHQDLLQTKQYKNDLDARKAKEIALSQMQAQLAIYGETVPLACGVFITLDDCSYDLYLYGNKAIPALMTTDFVHFHAIQTFQKEGVLHYDFCGFSGVLKPEDPYYGLGVYKQSFNGDMIETIGEFDYLYSPFVFYYFQLTRMLKLKIKKWIRFFKQLS